MNDQNQGDQSPQTKGTAHWYDVDFDKNLQAAAKAGKPVFVDFYADWCGPCQMAAPIVDKLAKEYEGKVEVVKVNVDENQATAGEFGVMSIPTVIVFKDGEEFERKTGFPGEQGYRDMLDQVVG
jgi:thioredoxin 1